MDCSAVCRFICHCTVTYWNKSPINIHRKGVSALRCSRKENSQRYYEIEKLQVASTPHLQQQQQQWADMGAKCAKPVRMVECVSPCYGWLDTTRSRWWVTLNCDNPYLLVALRRTLQCTLSESLWWDTVRLYLLSSTKQLARIKHPFLHSQRQHRYIVKCYSVQA